MFSAPENDLAYFFYAQDAVETSLTVKVIQGKEVIDD